jgi:hypothetical protein
MGRVASDPARTAGFLIRSFERTSRELVPTVGSQTLVELVTDFERSNDMDPVGGYAGLVLDHYAFGDPAEYLLGIHRPPRRERVPLLGCECGEWGCWPLMARIRIDDGKVIWDDFTQPHRLDRDYSGFGPFRFPEPDYRGAVADLCSRLARLAGTAP